VILQRLCHCILRIWSFFEKKIEDGYSYFRWSFYVQIEVSMEVSVLASIDLCFTEKKFPFRRVLDFGGFRWEFTEEKARA